MRLIATNDHIYEGVKYRRDEIIYVGRQSEIRKRTHSGYWRIYDQEAHK